MEAPSPVSSGTVRALQQAIRGTPRLWAKWCNILSIHRDWNAGYKMYVRRLLRRPEAISPPRAGLAAQNQREVPASGLVVPRQLRSVGVPAQENRHSFAAVSVVTACVEPSSFVTVPSCCAPQESVSAAAPRRRSVQAMECGMPLVLLVGVPANRSPFMLSTPSRSLLVSALAAGLASGLAGCGAPLPMNGVERSFSSPRGCADVLLYDGNSEDTSGLVFQASDRVSAARTAGMTTTFSLSLPQSGVKLQLLAGRNVTYQYCNDAIEANKRPVIDATYSATGGKATLTVTPTGAELGRATLLLENVVFHSDTGAGPDVTIPRYEMKDINVGWLAG